MKLRNDDTRTNCHVPISQCFQDDRIRWVRVDYKHKAIMSLDDP